MMVIVLKYTIIAISPLPYRENSLSLVLDLVWSWYGPGTGLVTECRWLFCCRL